MITVTLRIPFTSGSTFAVQLAQVTNADMTIDEQLAPTELTLNSDNTSWSGSYFLRILELDETAEFLANLGVPLTNDKRRAAVAGLFESLLTALLKKPVVETIGLS